MQATTQQPPVDIADQLEAARKALAQHGLVPAESMNLLSALVMAQALNRVAEALEGPQGAGVSFGTPAEPEGGEPDSKEPVPEPQRPTRFPLVGWKSPWKLCQPWNGSHVGGWVEVATGGLRATLPNGREFRVKSWRRVLIGEPWAPLAFISETFTVHHDTPEPPQRTPEPPKASAWQTGIPSTEYFWFWWDGGALKVFETQMWLNKHWSPCNYWAPLTPEPPQEPPAPSDTPNESEAAMEIREASAFGLCTPQEPPQPASPTPGDHPLDQGGWIRSWVPTERDADLDGEVKTATRDGQDWFWSHWSTVVLGQPWAPVSAPAPTACTPQPFPAHIAYPMSDGWIHDRVPESEDADQDGDVKIAANLASYIHWSSVVPGQPWKRTLAP